MSIFDKALFDMDCEGLIWIELDHLTSRHNNFASWIPIKNIQEKFEMIINSELASSCIDNIVRLYNRRNLSEFTLCDKKEIISFLLQNDIDINQLQFMIQSKNLALFIKLFCKYLRSNSKEDKEEMMACIEDIAITYYSGTVNNLINISLKKALNLSAGAA